jgi:hypothetical protein
MPAGAIALCVRCTLSTALVRTVMIGISLDSLHTDLSTHSVNVLAYTVAR